MYGGAAGWQAIASEAAKAVVGASAQDSADLKARGLVCANTNSKTYHTEGAFYGKRKEGKVLDRAVEYGYGVG